MARQEMTNTDCFFTGDHEWGLLMNEGSALAVFEDYKICRMYESYSLFKQ